MRKKLKNLICIALSLSVLITAFCLSPIAGLASDYSYAVLDDGTAELTAYNGSDEGVCIPEKIGGKTVTKLGEKLFYQNKTIKSVAIPETVKTIGPNAFAGCEGLTSVSLSEGLEVIGTYAFFGCTALESLELPKTLYALLGHSLSNTGLKALTIPENVKTIGTYCLAENQSLESVTLPEGLEVLPMRLFK